MPRLDDLPEGHVSASQLELFEACPAAWAMSYLAQMPRRENGPARDGKVLHAVIEHYGNALKRAGLSQAPDLLEPILAEVMAESEEPVRLGRIDWLREILAAFGRRYRLPEGDDVAFELVRWFDVGPRPVVMVIDELTRRGTWCRVRDWKSRLQMLPEWKVPENIQMRVYGYGVARLWPEVEEIEVVLHYLRYGQERSCKFARAEALEFGSWLEWQVCRMEAYAEAWRSVRGQGFPGAIASDHCRYCEWAPQCPLGQPRPLACDTPKAAVDIGQRLYVLDQLREQYRASLAEWCSSHGPLTISSGTFAHNVVVRYGVDERGEAALEVELAGRNLDLSDYLRGDSKGLRDLPEGARRVVGDLVKHELDRKKVREFCRRLRDAGLDPRPYLEIDSRALNALPADVRASVERVLEDRCYTRFDFKAG